MKTIVYFFAIFLIISACQKDELTEFQPDNPNIRYSGRMDWKNEKPVLISSASFVELSFSGDSCIIKMQNQNPDGLHNYISMELDGEYLGRMKIEGDDMQEYTITATKPESQHHLKIFKETEAQNGQVIFGGVKCNSLNELPSLPGKKIEFIGNSITCGMGADLEAIPCDAGVWYDQHNAYLAYGPRVARTLDAQFILSSVSGIGIYRNWNSNGPVMPDVYENTYLNTNTSIKWDFDKFMPDLVSICLGTNDFSDGDGINERLPFDSANYVSRYISFLKDIHQKYPKAQVCLLSSPMLSGEKADLLASCLNSIKEYLAANDPEMKPIAVYHFQTVVPHGCGYHPDINDHAEMAEELLPFYKEVMGW